MSNTIERSRFMRGEFEHLFVLSLGGPELMEECAQIEKEGWKFSDLKVEQLFTIPTESNPYGGYTSGRVLNHYMRPIPGKQGL